MGRLLSLAAGAVLLAGGSALAQEIPPASSLKVDFKQDILPILEQSCIKCHNADVQKSGLRMDTREFLVKGGGEGPSIVEGNSGESLIIKLAAGVHPDFDQMPPKGDKLTPEQIGLLRAWIDQGAVWPADVIASQYPAVAKAEGLPEDWKAEATAQTGPLALWGLSKDIKGPAGEPAIAVAHPDKTKPETTSLLWTPKAKFQNGMIEVKIKTSGGAEQGGGIAWRIKDKNNYYALRFDPLGKKLSLLKVIDGVETELKSAPVEAAADQWAALKVEQHGDQFAGYFNEQKVVEATDGALAEAGGAGYNVKGDALAAFAGTKLSPAQ